MRLNTPFSSLFFIFSFLFSLEQVLVSIVEAALNRCINITNVLPAVETAANAFYLLYLNYVQLFYFIVVYITENNILILQLTKLLVLPIMNIQGLYKDHVYTLVLFYFASWSYMQLHLSLSRIYTPMKQHCM